VASEEERWVRHPETARLDAFGQERMSMHLPELTSECAICLRSALRQLVAAVDAYPHQHKWLRETVEYERAKEAVDG
jgi:hypothetical protein